MFLYQTSEQQKMQKVIQKKAALEKSPSHNKTGIPNDVKSKFEGKSGYSLDDVRVHYNSNKPKTFKALAYTQGNEIHIGPGQEKHLGHELTHVVQQKNGVVKPTTSMNGVPVNDELSLEAEADKQLPILQKKKEVSNTGSFVVQMIGERAALKSTMKKKDSTTKIRTSEIKMSNPIEDSIRRGNRKRSIDDTNNESKIRVELLRAEYGELENAYNKKFGDLNENLQTMIRARAAYVAGAGNCNELSAIVFSNLVSNTTNQYVYSCKMKSNRKGEVFDHVFIVTSHKKYETGSFPIMSNYDDITVIDPWKQYTICTFQQFIEGEHPFFEQQKVLIPNENIVIQNVMKADPKNKLSQEKEEFIDRYLEDFDQKVQETMRRDELNRREVSKESVSLGGSEFEDKGLIEALSGKANFGKLKRTNKEGGLYFDSKEPWERRIKDLRPNIVQLEELDEDNIHIIGKLLIENKEIEVFNKLRNVEDKLLSSIIGKVTEDMRLGSLPANILNNIPIGLINRMKESDVVKVLSLLQDKKQAGRYLISMYGCCLCGGNSKRVETILKNSYGALNEVIKCLPEYKCWTLTKSKAESMAKPESEEGISSTSGNFFSMN